MIYLEGVVKSGLGKAGDFIKADVYAKQYEHKLGFKPFAGTLNIKLQNDLCIDIEDKYASILKKINGADGYGDVFFLFADISLADNSKTEHGAILFPVKSVYTTSTLEFISSVNLRRTMNLSDGDVVVVKIRD